MWEFYAGGPRAHFYMYSQHRDTHTDWDAVIRAIDELWEPFAYDAAPLVDAFPLPLAYDALHDRIPGYDQLKELRF